MADWTDDYSIIGAAADNFDCDAITNWTATGNAAAVVLNTTAGDRVEGTGCLELRTSGDLTGYSGWYHNLTSGSRFKITDEQLVVPFYYVKGKGAALLTDASSAVIIRLYFGGTTQYAEYHPTDAGNLTLRFGWNWLVVAGTNYNGGGELLTITGTPSPAFAVDDVLTGATSGAKATITKVLTAQTFLVTHPSGSGFSASETINSDGGGSGTFSASPDLTADVHRAGIDLDFSNPNESGGNDPALRMDAWFSGTEIQCTSGPGDTKDEDDLVLYSETRTAFPLGLVEKQGNFVNIRSGLHIGNGSSGVDNEGHMKFESLVLLFNQASEEVPYDITIENHSTLTFGDLESGSDDDYPVRGCRVNLPDNRDADIDLKDGGELNVYDTTFYQWRYAYLGAATETAESTLLLLGAIFDSCETVYIRATTTEIGILEIYNNSGDVNNHCAEMIVTPVYCLDFLVHDCNHGVYFRDDLTLKNYRAQDNTNYDLGILEGKAVNLINSFFDSTKIIRQAA